MSLALPHRPVPKNAWPWVATGVAVTFALAATVLHDTVFQHGRTTSGAAGSPAAPTASPPPGATTTVTLPEGKLRAAHIATAPAERTTLATAIDVAGRIDANLDRRVDVHPRAAGVIRRVAVALGQHVKKGDELATLDSPDIGTAQLNLWARQRDLGIARTEFQWKATIAANVAQLVPELRARAQKLREEGKGPHGAHEGATVLNEEDPAAELEQKYADRPLGNYRASLLAAYAEFLIAAHEEEKTTGLYRAKVLGEHPYFLAVHTRQSAQAKLGGILEQNRFDAAQQEKIARNAVRKAEGDVVDAAQRLRILGAPVDLDAALAPSGPGAPAHRDPVILEHQDVTAYTIVAPFDGTIIDKTAMAVVSQKVDVADTLFSLADVTDVWVQANIPESDFGVLPAFRTGTIHLTAAAYPGKTFDARLLSVGSVVDPATRTVPLLAETKNPEGLLKLGMFVRIVLDTTRQTISLTVPAAAIVEIDGRKGVFVPAGDDGHAFTFQPVKVGREADGRQVITEGLQPGRPVVAEGAFVLKSELILQNDTEED
jgi:cobalt-zinc-cadmium efflux system membrane fusion protein